MSTVKGSNIAIAVAAVGAIAITSRFAWKRIKKRKAE